MMDADMIDTEALNRAVVRRWFAALWGNPYDLDVVDELAMPDVRLQYSEHGARCGREAVKAFMIEFRGAFPDFGFRRIGTFITDHDIVVLRWEGNGTHTGPAFNDFHIGPLPMASGHKVILSGHNAVRLEDGMIVEEAVWSTERKATLRCITGGLLV